MTLKGKVAIVTGGNSGIGLAIVLELAKQGANIVIDYVAHPEATEALEKQVNALGDQAIGIQADVSKVADLQRLIAAAVKQFGRVDIMPKKPPPNTSRPLVSLRLIQKPKLSISFWNISLRKSTSPLPVCSISI